MTATLTTEQRAALGAEAGGLHNVVSTYQRWLHLPDPSALLVVLGAVAANQLDGDPVWPLIVGPPGSGKTEVLLGITALEDVHPAATLTAAALLSGTPKKERANSAKGGLLQTIGEFGIIVCKDFGSVLSMHRDARSEVLAGLREVYDGSWTRHVGTDGGKTLHWSGKVGLIAGCTPTIDRHHAVMSSMGERFLFFRLPEGQSDQQARRALAHAGKEKAMRAELAGATAALFRAGLATPRSLSDEETDALISLTTLVVRCRSAVERDGYTREIELIPPPEAPTRLAVVLERLLAGLDAIGVERPIAWQVMAKAALDSMPASRLRVVDCLHRADDELPTAKVAEAVDYPTKTIARVLEDLTAHGVVVVSRGGQGHANTWRLSDWTVERYAAARGWPETSDGVRGTQPETSGNNSLNSPNHSFDDISGRVPLVPGGGAA